MKLFHKPRFLWLFGIFLLWLAIHYWDALLGVLGAAARGDIGAHFPDTDPAWAGADSAQLLARVVAELAANGFHVGNVDATVICEAPKLRPHVATIRARLAGLLGVAVSRVSVKGKTNERMDDVGAGLGIAVHCVALLEETP